MIVKGEKCKMSQNKLFYIFYEMSKQKINTNTNKY